MKLDADLVRRFWLKVSKRGPNECWPWTGARTRGGYGHLKLSKSRKVVRASRVSFAIYKGVPKRLVLHTCDNPPCCNPSHLYDDSHKKNAADMMARGRARHLGAGRGEDHPLAKITDAQAEKIKHSKRLQREDAALYGISQVMVSVIRRGLRKKAK